MTIVEQMVAQAERAIAAARRERERGRTDLADQALGEALDCLTVARDALWLQRPAEASPPGHVGGMWG